MCDRTDFHVHTTLGILAPTEPLDSPHWKARYAALANHANQEGDASTLIRLATIAALRFERDNAVAEIMKPPAPLNAVDMQPAYPPTLALVADDSPPDKGGNHEPSPETLNPRKTGTETSRESSSWFSRLTWLPFFSFSRS